MSTYLNGKSRNLQQWPINRNTYSVTTHVEKWFYINWGMKLTLLFYRSGPSIHRKRLSITAKQTAQMKAIKKARPTVSYSCGDVAPVGQ